MMAFHGYVTPKGRNKIIDREQTGSAAMTLPEQVAFYDEEIRKAKSWIAFYTNPKNRKSINPKMAATYTALAAKLENEREICLAKLYASKLRNIKGGKIELAKAAK
jgi:hypothetical protein